MAITPERLDQLRNETPSCHTQIHFNNAGASLIPDPVYYALKEHLDLERHIGGYSAEEAAEASLSRFYGAIAQLVNASASEIAFAQNHSRAWETGIRAIEWKKGDRLLIHESAYNSNYLTFLHLKKTKEIALDIVPSDKNGLIDLEALPALLSSNTKAIAVTHMPTFDGSVQPVEKVGAFAREHGLLYILDACQSVGQTVVDVKKIGCHIMAGTGRKWLRGPRGTGFLYISKDIIESLTPVLIDNISAHQIDENRFDWTEGAKRFETYERHVAGQIGLAIAADYAHAIGLENIQTRVTYLASTLRHALSDISGVKGLEDKEAQSGIVTFHADNKDTKSVIKTLWDHKVAVSFVSPEHAYFKFQKLGLNGAIRASIHYYNTEAEIDRFCQILKENI